MRNYLREGIDLINSDNYEEVASPKIGLIDNPFGILVKPKYRYRKFNHLTISLSDLTASSLSSAVPRYSTESSNMARGE